MTKNPESSSPTMFVNLPVRDIARSMEFFEKLGFEFDQHFTDDNAACMIVGGGAYVMLLTRSFFASFTSRTLADPRQTISGLYALALPSRADVDALASKVEAAGGEVLPAKDMGFMYQRSFVDLDGYQWEPFHMDGEAFEDSHRSST
ncbi:MAG: VOC family protein [Myxococcota bacterium]